MEVSDYGQSRYIRYGSVRTFDAMDSQAGGSNEDPGKYSPVMISYSTTISGIWNIGKQWYKFNDTLLILCWCWKGSCIQIKYKLEK